MENHSKQDKCPIHPFRPANIGSVYKCLAYCIRRSVSGFVNGSPNNVCGGGGLTNRPQYVGALFENSISYKLVCKFDIVGKSFIIMYIILYRAPEVYWFYSSFVLSNRF